MINIEIKHPTEAPVSFLPITECWGAEHGEVYQQYVGGRVSKVYFIGTGMHDNPVMLWWDEEDDKWCLSSQSYEELSQYNSHVKIRKIDAKVTIKLEV